MVLSVKVGSFTTATTAGTQTITGVGFTPKAVFLWYTAMSTTPLASDGQITWGFSTGSSNSYSGGVASYSAQTTSETCRISGTNVVQMVQFDQSAINTATLSSFNSDGFVVNWTTAFSSGFTCHYICIGGADLSNAKAITWNGQTGTGNQTVTGVGFQPDLVLNFGIEDIPMSTSGTSDSLLFGAADYQGNQWCHYSYDRTSHNPSVTGRIQATDGFIIGTGLTTALTYKASLSSFNSDGFVVNWSKTDSTARSFATLCLKGGGYTVGSWAKTTGSNGSIDTVTPAQVTPQAVMLFNDSNTVTTSHTTGARLFIGASDGSSHQCGGRTCKNNVSPTVDAKGNETAHAIDVSNADSTSTIDAYCTLGTFAAQQFEATWTTNNAVATQILYIAIGARNYTGSLTTIVVTANIGALGVGADCNVAALTTNTVNGTQPSIGTIRADCNVASLTSIVGNANMVTPTLRADCILAALTSTSATANSLSPSLEVDHTNTPTTIVVNANNGSVTMRGDYAPSLSSIVANTNVVPLTLNADMNLSVSTISELANAGVMAIAQEDENITLTTISGAIAADTGLLVLEIDYSGSLDVPLAQVNAVTPTIFCGYVQTLTTVSATVNEGVVAMRGDYGATPDAIAVLANVVAPSTVINATTTVSSAIVNANTVAPMMSGDWSTSLNSALCAVNPGSASLKVDYAGGVTSVAAVVNAGSAAMTGAYAASLSPSSALANMSECSVTYGGVIPLSTLSVSVNPVAPAVAYDTNLSVNPVAALVNAVGVLFGEVEQILLSSLHVNAASGATSLEVDYTGAMSSIEVPVNIVEATAIFGFFLETVSAQAWPGFLDVTQCDQNLSIDTSTVLAQAIQVAWGAAIWVTLQVVSVMARAGRACCPIIVIRVFFRIHTDFPFPSVLKGTYKGVPIN